MDWLVVVCGRGRGDRYGLGVLNVLNKCGVVCRTLETTMHT